MSPMFMCSGGPWKTSFTAAGSHRKTTSVLGPEAHAERVAVALPAAGHEALGIGDPLERLDEGGPSRPGRKLQGEAGSVRVGRGSSRRSCPLRRSGVPRSLARRISAGRRSFVKPAISCQFAAPDAPRQRMRAVCQPFAPQMTHSLVNDDMALRPLDAGAWEGTIEEGWYAGLGPLGGYVMALVLRGLGSRPPTRRASHGPSPSTSCARRSPGRSSCGPGSSGRPLPVHRVRPTGTGWRADRAGPGGAVGSALRSGDLGAPIPVVTHRRPVRSRRRRGPKSPPPSRRA